MDEKINEYALIFKALSDPNRLLIIEYLLESERCACKILDRLSINQSTLSYHMKILCDSTIVNAKKEGKWIHYSLNRNKFEEVIKMLDKFAEDKFNNVKSCLCK